MDQQKLLTVRQDRFQKSSRTVRNLKNQPAQKDCHAAADCDDEEIAVDPGDDETHDQGGGTGPEIVSGCDDSRKGHDCQRHIGHIVQKGPDKLVCDGLP